jgi:hypothetical protein
MDERLKQYFQHERMHAIDEFVNELNYYICDVKKYYRRDRWQQIVTDVRKTMNEKRDLYNDREEPLIPLCHCIGFDSHGKVCKSRASKGPFCSKHSPKANH